MQPNKRNIAAIALASVGGMAIALGATLVQQAAPDTLTFILPAAHVNPDGSRSYTVDLRGNGGVVQPTPTPPPPTGTPTPIPTPTPPGATPTPTPTPGPTPTPAPPSPSPTPTPTPVPPTPGPTPTPTPTPTPVPPTPGPTPTPQPSPTPAPPPGMDMAAVAVPTNLRVIGKWDASAKKPYDVLAWDAAPGAVSYRVYQQDVAIGNATGNTFTVPASAWVENATYTVTAMDAGGMESLPSAACVARGAYNPTGGTPSWVPGTPPTPRTPTVTPQWNNGKPRNLVAWSSDPGAYYYRVYRDGQLIADGVWVLYYVDDSAAPRSVHSYAVSGITDGWNGAQTLQESASTPGVSATALGSDPTPVNVPTVTGVTLVPGDGFVTVRFPAVPGAVDYRVYNTATPGSYKYSGGGLEINENGQPPTGTNTYVVEALDKMGPFMKMDGAMPPGYMAGMASHTNGQGEPSNVPNVIARFAPVSTSCVPFVLTGQQAFLDTFRNAVAFTPAVVPQPLLNANSGDVTAVENNNWVIYNVLGDQKASRVFIMKNHLMDTLYDGGNIGGGDNFPPHNNNASLLMLPKATADISGGKVLHVTFRVDKHMYDRKWCDLFLMEQGDVIKFPGKFAEGGLLPTVKGNLFRWEILHDHHAAEVFTNNGGALKTDYVNIPIYDNPQYAYRARVSDGKGYQGNGDHTLLDDAKKFDLYISQSHVQLYEDGRQIVDTDLPRPLHFTKIQPVFVHQVYHTDNARNEQMQFHAGEGQYHYNYRAYDDLRHWENLGHEVLDKFPTPDQVGK